MCQDNPDLLPLYVSDEEKLARALFHPFHISRSGKLYSGAFKAPAGRNDVSVNRLRALSPAACKQRAKAIRSPGEFMGFAVLSARAVRDCASEVVDSRNVYLGHADIVHEVILHKGEPAPPEFNLRLKRMAASARYVPDPNPGSEQWSGGAP